MVLAALVVLCQAAELVASSLAIVPERIELAARELPQRLLVVDWQDGQSLGPVAETVVWTSSDPQVVVVEQQQAVATGNGQATLTAQVGDRWASVAVRVAGLDADFHWSFRNHVESVLTKAGCNSGACHGAAAGKNGFRLSLRAYDPEGDFLSLSRQARGRRVVPADPGRSLLLTKPTGAVPHRGGVRLAVGGRDYQLLADWIAAGAAPPKADDPRLESLDILPRRSRLKPGQSQPLVVQARFSDGRVEDVTSWAKFTAANSSVAEVNDQGVVQVVGAGEGAVTAWYLSRVVTATVAVPFANDVPAQRFAAEPRHNLIDEHVLAKLAELRLPPSPAADDSTLIRRAYLDTLGVLPTRQETEAFLTDTAADKRDRLIDALLARPELVDYWTYRWSDLLLVTSERLPPAAMWSYHHWVRNQVAANTPWNKVAQQLLTATGSTLEQGAANFYLLHPDPLDLAETTTVAFLGMSINCARCHNHPLEKWTNDQYFAMANLFAQVRTKNTAGDAQQVVFDAREGDVVQPLRGRPQVPAPLDAPPLAGGDAVARRVHLANWLTAPDNPYFARAIVNRVWANFFAVGLVEPVDDMRLSNPASNEALLTALSAWLVENGYDLRKFMRLILTSATYQRSSQSLPENAADERFYSRYYPRRLMAEVLLDAVSQVTQVPTEFPGYPAGWRALQLPDSNVASYFLKTFGRPDRAITCECERTAEPSMVQVLHLANGDVLNKKLAAPGNRLEQLAAVGTGTAAWLDEAMGTALCRPPTAAERAQLGEVLATIEPDQRRAALEDLYWGIFSSKEFLFNH